MLNLILNGKCRTKTQFILGFFCFFLNITNGFAQQSITSTAISQLANSAEWIKILGQDDHNLTSYAGQNRIKGETQPSSLDVLLESIDMYTDFSSGESVDICDYPARAVFVSFKVMNENEVDLSKCTAFNDWIGGNSIESISLLFASGYLKNPASFYGHILLKFNKSSATDSSDLLDQALNYGAETGRDAALPYVVKGLFGSYEAHFSQESFFRMSATYQDLQKRDIFEYPLVLTDYQRQLLLALSYEYSKHSYRYYFLSDNCAYRMAGLIAAATGENLTSPYPWSTPVDVLMALDATAMLATPKLHASRMTTAAHRLSKLNYAEYNRVKAFIEEEHNTHKVSDFDNKISLAALDTLNYLKEYIEDGKVSKQQLEVEKKRKALLLNLKPEQSESNLDVTTVYPHEAQKPTMIELEAEHGHNPNSAWFLTLRAANFDLLDGYNQHANSSEFTFLSPTMAYNEDRISLEKLVLFKVLKLDDSLIKIPGENTFAWGISAAYENVSEKCISCGVAKFTGTIGKSLRINYSTSIYSLTNIAIHESRYGSGNASVTPELGLKYKRGRFGAKLGYSVERFAPPSKLDGENFQLRLLYTNSPKSGVGLVYLKTSNTSSIRLSMRRYF